MGDQLEIDFDSWPYGSPSVAMNVVGVFVVVWHDNDPYGTDNWGWHVNAKRYDSFGNLLAGLFQINTYTTDHQRFPAVAINDAGDFVVAWESIGSSGAHTDGHNIQRTPGTSIFADGFESGDTSAWQ